MGERDLRPGADKAHRTRADAVAVGLAGGIGAGKSTALDMFAELGAVTASADRIVHHLYGSTRFVERLLARFGPGIADDQGRIDRRRLSETVKGDNDGLRWLEQLTHPMVKREIERVLRDAPSGSIVVCEVPLLFEAGFGEMFDLVVTIEASRENRFGRSSHRFDPAVFAEFENLQASGERRMMGSDMVYHNDGSLEGLRDFVHEAYSRAVSLLSSKRSAGMT